MADREMTNEEAIEILGGIQACYNIFDEYDEPKYAALSKAIFALKAEQIKRGQWEPSDYDRYYQCSECGSYTYEENLWDYCPSCGAKMDEVKE